MLGFSMTKIVGTSMVPRLQDGSFACFVTGRQSALSIGQVCKIEHPRYGTIVKQVAFIDRNGLYWFKGVNQVNSVSMIDIGPIRREQVTGYLWFSLSPPQPKDNEPMQHNGAG